MNDPDLTPTQDLILGVVGARYRLGEPFWSFEKRHMRAIKGLEDLGLVTWRAHNGSHLHVYVTLTTAGVKAAVSDTYVPPVFDENSIMRAVGDPGSVVGVRDPGESVVRWSTRAVMVTLLQRDKR